MSSRELLLACLRGEPTPRPPVICGGGMMSFAIAEAMDACGCYWPEAHHEADAMAKLALATQRASGFDAVAVPFCMTIEAEELGADIHFGSRDVQPRVLAEPMREVRDLSALQSPSEKPGPRRQVTLQAIRLLRERAREVAVLGATVGPFSLAGQVLEAGLLLRAVRRDPAAVHDLLRRCAPVVADFARSQVEAGADAIVISDPTATGELLGAEAYAEFAEPYLGQAVAAVREAGAPAIVHVCGCPNTILGHLADLEVAAAPSGPRRTSAPATDGQHQRRVAAGGTAGGHRRQRPAGLGHGGGHPGPGVWSDRPDPGGASAGAGRGGGGATVGAVTRPRPGHGRSGHHTATPPR